jgi:predicted dehydrogenase
MRVALLGYGAVAEVHAAQLKTMDGVRLTAVCGPDLNKGRGFAERHAIEVATCSLATALAAADAVIVASPTPKHFEHAMQLTVPALIELPPCASGAEARAIEGHFAAHAALVRCAHTSRHLEPYRRIGAWIRAGELGAIRQIIYYRHLIPRHRSWSDHALLHHAAHPVDLLLDWFGEIEPVGCAAPDGDGSATVTLLARLPGKAPASVSVSYESSSAASRMLVVGSRKTVATDGFSFIDADEPAWQWRGDSQETYEQAIQDQDAAFVRACQGQDAGVPWRETIRLMDLLDAFRGLL